MNGDQQVVASGKVRWGILGTGHIARKFAEGLAFQPDAELVAIGSRSQATAVAFGDDFDVRRRYASYEALAGDPDVQVVYVATPHTLHRDNSRLCLQAGKAVLCEKPFAINAAEAAELIELARERQLFLMEAMWTRFLPLFVEVRSLLAQEVIGEVRMVTADFGFRAEPIDPRSRLFDPALGGGALLDVGIYPVTLAFMVLGRPAQAMSMAHLGRTGVDEQAAIILGYEQGQLAVLTTATRTETPQEATLFGTQGSIKIHSPWWRSTHLTLSIKGAPDRVIERPIASNGYNYEAAEVIRCLRAGRLESEVMPLDETLAMMCTLDEIRAQWGLKYPGE